MADLIKIPSDHHAREEALGMGSFIVQAPAGSGRHHYWLKRFSNPAS